MNMEELKHAKEELEKMQKYVIIEKFLDEKDQIEMTKQEILSRVDTDKTVKQIEKMIEESTKMLIDKYIEFDEIRLISSMGVICTKPYADELKKGPKYSEDFTLDEEMKWQEKWQTIYSKLPKNVLPNIVPVKFYLFTGQEDYTLTREEQQKLSVSGLVDYNEFIKKINGLGYNTEIVDYEKGENTFTNYIDKLASNNSQELIEITADFKEAEKQNGTKSHK